MTDFSTPHPNQYEFIAISRNAPKVIRVICISITHLLAHATSTVLETKQRESENSIIGRRLPRLRRLLYHQLKLWCVVLVYTIGEAWLLILILI